jgi:hypothetical protein
MTQTNEARKTVALAMTETNSSTASTQTRDEDERAKTRTIPFPHLGGFRPGLPCPDLFTEEEAILYLRIDTIDIRNPGETLQRYRKSGQLRGTQISKRVYYRRQELDAFLEKVTDDNPR